jgi:hypothetical protein
MLLSCDTKFGGSRTNVALKYKAIPIKIGTERSDIFAAVLNEDSCGKTVDVQDSSAIIFAGK